MNRKFVVAIASLIALILLITIGKLAYPTATAIILNILWFFLLSVTVIFFALGILAIMGLKKEVGQLLEMFLEGSFSLIDLVRKIREFVHLFVEEIKNALLMLAPLFSYILGLCVYLLFIYLYKLVGTDYDVTVLTVALTVVMIGTVGLLNYQNPMGIERSDWPGKFKKKVRDTFTDSLEVVIFIFFLTMDSTRLFFVPENLNVPLRAEFLDYDLMVRAFHLEDTRVTLTIIIIAIISEIIRNILRVVSMAKKYFRDSSGYGSYMGDPEQARYQRIKDSIRHSFSESKDEIVKFITFTTLLILVFLLFPRLKLLSMAVASLTALSLDLLIPSRLVITKNNDLVSRILGKIFKF
jgi:hypothetical protein